KFQFTGSRACRDKLREAQDLLRHRIPDGNVATIFERALDLLIEQVKKERFAQVRKARQPANENRETPSSRHIPAAIQREVVARARQWMPLARAGPEVTNREFRNELVVSSGMECAFPSMFALCVGELGISEDAAYNRIAVARVGRRFPAVIEAMRSGRINLWG